VARSRADRLRRRNIRDGWYHDLYHRALMLPWYGFLAIGCILYLGVNVVFATLFLLQPGSIAGARPGFWDAFFFSIQTIATIGYGVMSPGSFYGNVLMTMETMTGLVFIALATGITFARISRPTARVMFARVAVVAPHNGVPTLQIRLANERLSQILEADVTVSVLRWERTTEGIMIRRFYDLALLRSHTPVFALSFTLLHPIDERSALFGLSPQTVLDERSELLVAVTGLEEMTSQTVHARHSYTADEIMFGHRYRDIFLRDEKGSLIDYGLFHETVAVTPAFSPQGDPRDRPGDDGKI
jgi:inward rectifier potassium channel